MPATVHAHANERREHREDVHHRTLAVGPDGANLPAVIVNVSPHGLMARCGATLAPGDTLTFRLPDRVARTAQVRWALGGRVGCEFAQPFETAAFFALLPRLR